jgi:hypothetical protein
MSKRTTITEIRLNKTENLITVNHVDKTILLSYTGGTPTKLKSIKLSYRDQSEFAIQDDDSEVTYQAIDTLRKVVDEWEAAAQKEFVDG